jgi:hypothetical protein
MRDWKKELRGLMNCVDPHGEVKDFWDFVDIRKNLNLDEQLEIRKGIYPILESLLSEQEKKHKKELREAMRDCMDYLTANNAMAVTETGREILLDVLFKKYNCEQEKK